MSSVICPRCGSDNISFQVHQETKTITKTKSNYKEKRHGLLWKICIGWWWWIVDVFLWIFLFIPRALLRIGRKRNYTSKTKTVTQDRARYKTICVCQNCGHNWNK